MPNGRSRGRRRGRRPKRRSNEKGGRTVQTAAPALFAFMGSLSSSVGLSAWRWACAVPRCGSRCFRNGQRKAIIRTHRLSETGSDYIGLVREMGLEPTHHRYWLLRPARLPFRHSRREQPLSYHEKGPAVKSPATKEVWRWLCGGSTGISPPALRSNGHQPAFTCRFAILPTSPAASGDHPVKTVTSLIFWNPSPA